MSLGPTIKMEILKKISLGELFVVKMLGPGGASMNHKTFGNMIHPNGWEPLLEAEVAEKRSLHTARSSKSARVHNKVG